MICDLPHDLVWDILFPLLDPVSLSRCVVSCKPMMEYIASCPEYWEKRIWKDGLYTNERPFPEYGSNPGIVFLRLTHCQGRKKMTQRYCFSCQEQTNSLHDVYQIPVCKACRSTKIPYRMITRTTAMKEYCLKAREVDSIPFLQVANPHYRSAAPMRLYLLRDVLSVQGDRDVETIKAKKEVQLKKRRQTIAMTREERRHQLTNALQEIGLEYREDNELCRTFLINKQIDLSMVVEETAFLHYLHQYTDYHDRLEDYVETLYDDAGFYFNDIWHEASDNVRRKYKRPKVWPWLIHK